MATNFSWTDLIPLAAGAYAGNQTQGAARESAQASLEAAQIAADAAKFKPYSITSGLGTSWFDEDKQQAGYTLDPTLQGFRNAMYGGAGEFLSQIQSDPQAAAQKYYNEQMALQQGSRGAEDIALRQQQLQRGRIGLGLSGEAMGAGAGTGYVNPEQYQRDLARSMADQQLAAQSTQLAQADIDRAITRGTGMLQTGLGIEQLGLQPLQIGADIGNRVATAGANQGQMLLSGANYANQANLAAGLNRSNMIMSGAQGAMGMWNQPRKPV